MRYPCRSTAHLLFVLVLMAGVVQGGEPSEQRRQELLYLLHQDCGACHGMTLKGGLGPALLPGALQGKPRPYLSATILDGHPGTPMPPWRPFLSEDEVAWLVERLIAGATQ